ncbi:ferric reductase transmembrane protein [Novymonas esmeraldas]|uniref:Ferric reductase transmembrane protein n=1 Tax=Novymonas esmeraldas TaxID=1808958 RepID=A0AAW0EMY6_9TRYP
MADKVEEMRLMPVPVQIYYVLGCAVVSLALSVCGICLWEKSPYVAGGGSTLWAYTPAGLAGLLLFASFTSSTVALLYEASQMFVRYTQHPSHGMSKRGRSMRQVAIAVQALLGAGFAGVASAAMAKWGVQTMRCGVIFCLDVVKYPAVAAPRGTVFNFHFSAMLFATLIPLALTMWYRSFTLLYEERRQSDGTAPPATAKPPALQLYHTPRVWRRVASIVGLCLAICAFALLTFWLPNDPRRYLPNALAAYAALGISRVAPSPTATVPELPNAWMRSGQIRVSSTLVLKLYPSTMLFYGYLLLVCVTVFVVRQSRKGAYWAARRLPGRLSAFTAAETAFIAVTALMCTLFFIYWKHDHNYRVLWRGSTTSGSPMLAHENWGRSLGQLAVLFLSVLLLPVGRRSVVVTVLGVSRDGLLWFHRAVGYAMLAATIGHMIAFYVSFAHYDQLLKNFNDFPMIVGYSQTRGSFTVAYIEWPAWLLLISMGLFALNFTRRYCYELFYYTHIFATYASLPLILFHAPAGWMYLLPGMTLWLVDQLVRLCQRSAVVRVVHARVISEDTTELAFTVPGRWDMRTVHPGQYVFVCVPELTALQWHPFTLTSVVEEESLPDADGAERASGTVFYVHIKSMGPRTWTKRLYNLVRAGYAITMAVEGPCGMPVDFGHYDDIVLVAGGIGVTPCVSIFGSLLRASGKISPRAVVPRVQCIWSTRSGRHVNAVADLLQLPVRCGDVVRLPVDSASRSGVQCGAAAAEERQDGGEKGVDRVTSGFAFDVYVTRDDELQHFARAPGSEGSASPSSTSSDRDTPDDGLLGRPTGSAGEVHCPFHARAPGKRQPPAPATAEKRGGAPQSRENALEMRSLTPSFLMEEEGTTTAAAAAAPTTHEGRDGESQGREEQDSGEGSSVEEGVPVAEFDTDLKRAGGGRRDSGESNTSGGGGAVLEVHTGRPDVSRLVKDAVAERCRDKTRTLLFVCGPQALVDLVVSTGAQLGVEVHTEVFLF